VKAAWFEFDQCVCFFKYVMKLSWGQMQMDRESDRCDNLVRSSGCNRFEEKKRENGSPDPVSEIVERIHIEVVC
jgi:hypothetical protein